MKESFKPEWSCNPQVKIYWSREGRELLQLNIRGKNGIGLDFKRGKRFETNSLPRKKYKSPSTIKDFKRSVYNYPLANKRAVFPASKEGIKSWHRISTHGNAREKWKRTSAQDLFTKDRHCSVCVFGSETEWGIDMCFTMSEPWEHCDKKNNPSFFLPRVRQSKRKSSDQCSSGLTVAGAAHDYYAF